MNSLEEYIYWRGDLSFTQDPFNEIDGLILSELSYIDYLSLSSPIPKTINEAASIWSKTSVRDLVHKDEIVRSLAYNLLLHAGQSKRFGSLTLEDFVYEVSIQDNSQFGALKYLDKDRELFIAFQGTDLHVVGWKEDFALSYLPMIPSQEKAREYLFYHLQGLEEPIYIGGHSKGGNLAIYSAIFQEESLQDKIKGIYNYDGPGFNSQILEEPGYLRISSKIHTYLPEDSLVGLLLHRLEEEIVIGASCKGLKQHLGYYWKLEKNFFQRAKLSKDAKKFALVLDRTLDQLDDTQRKKLTDAVFSLFGEDMENNLLIGTTSYNLRKFQQALYQLTKLSPESKKLLLDVVVSLLRHRMDLKNI